MRSIREFSFGSCSRPVVGRYTHTYICTDTAVRQAGTYVGIARKENNYLTYPTIMYDHCDVMLLT